MLSRPKEQEPVVSPVIPDEPASAESIGSDPQWVSQASRCVCPGSVRSVLIQIEVCTFVANQLPLWAESNVSGCICEENFDSLNCVCR